jgi:hypothetical protein
LQPSPSKAGASVTSSLNLFPSSVSLRVTVQEDYIVIEVSVDRDTLTNEVWAASAATVEKFIIWRMVTESIDPGWKNERNIR